MIAGVDGAGLVIRQARRPMRDATAQDGVKTSSRG
jgi:hypothetical protein